MLNVSCTPSESYIDDYIVISVSNDRYQDLSDEAGPLGVLHSRMPKLKAANGSEFN